MTDERIEHEVFDAEVAERDRALIIDHTAERAADMVVAMVRCGVTDREHFRREIEQILSASDRI
jgi:hypothetical protein